MTRLRNLRIVSREGMLELSRGMTAAHTSVARVAGAYLDNECHVDGTFNTNFLKLPAGERTKNLNLAKHCYLRQIEREVKENEEQVFSNCLC